jgi:uncharacterized membrane protein YqjE
MPTTERSLADVLQDIVRNVQDIVRSEVLLARTEIREELAKASSAIALIGGAVIAGSFALFFLLFALMYGLMTVVPDWAAALIVAVLLGVIAAIALVMGKSWLRQVRPAPEKTIESMKENLEWAKRHAR